MNPPAHDSSTPWKDAGRPIAERVDSLLDRMSVEEKTAQLVGLWVRASEDGEDVAPHQHDLSDAVALGDVLPTGLGQLTRPFGSAPIEPSAGAASLARTQQSIARANRFGIPAVVHEECLAGFAAWGATAYPVPLSWGASFNPALVSEMAARIGADMHGVGVHQGLAPVLDVVRDYRWGRVEETIGEDPYLVGSIASAYVRGLQSSGVLATLKHFAGYSASRAGRNLAPVSMGPRERADVILPPFEMAVREAGAGSVMHAYTDSDGVPSAGDRQLLTELLRDTWGFAGTVVADYFGVSFLKELHGVAATWGEAAVRALTAGVDVELPSVKTFGEPLREEVRAGRVSIDTVDTAVRRVLTQKVQLGLLDADWSPVKSASPTGGKSVDLDNPGNRQLARTLAEQSVVLIRNDGTLPLSRPTRIAVVGPNADEPLAPLGCYSFPRHVGLGHPDVPVGIDLPTVREAVVAEFPDADVRYSPGCPVDDDDASGIGEAAALAGWADITICVLGDRAGLFGRGTSGEGCDAADLRLPGVQARLVDALAAADTALIVTLIAGRPYALGAAATAPAILQTFFPGEEGASAIAGVLSGRINPSGRLPVGIPATPWAGPGTYLSAKLGHRSDVSTIDPTPAFAFGHGLGYTTFDWTGLDVESSRTPTDGAFRLSFTVANTGGRPGTDVVQLYLHDPVASVVQPVERLIGFVRVDLAPGETAPIGVALPADLASFTGADGTRIVEPGALELRISQSSTDVRLRAELELTGPVRVVDHTRRLHPLIDVGAPEGDSRRAVVG